MNFAARPRHGPSPLTEIDKHEILGRLSAWTTFESAGKIVHDDGAGPDQESASQEQAEEPVEAQILSIEDDESIESEDSSSSSPWSPSSTIALPGSETKLSITDPFPMRPDSPDSLDDFQPSQILRAAKVTNNKITPTLKRKIECIDLTEYCEIQPSRSTRSQAKISDVAYYRLNSKLDLKKKRRRVGNGSDD